MGKVDAEPRHKVQWDRQVAGALAALGQAEVSALIAPRDEVHLAQSTATQHRTLPRTVTIPLCNEFALRQVSRTLPKVEGIAGQALKHDLKHYNTKQIRILRLKSKQCIRIMLTIIKYD